MKGLAAAAKRSDRVYRVDGVLGKLCSKCNTWRPLAEWGRDKATKDGLPTRCKACRRAYSREHADTARERAALWYRNNHARAAERTKAQAKTRGETRDASTREDEERTYFQWKEEIQPHRAAFWQRMREQRREYLRVYEKAYFSDPEKQELRRQRSRKYYATEKGQRTIQSYRQSHPESQREATRRWSERNSDKRRAYRMATRDARRAYHRQHYAANKARYFANSRRHRARRVAAEGSHTAQEWEALCAFYNQRCLHCGNSGSLTVDHVIPLSKGGRDDTSNLQPLCRPCNIAKAVRAWDFRPQNI